MGEQNEKCKPLLDEIYKNLTLDQATTTLLKDGP